MAHFQLPLPPSPSTPSLWQTLRFARDPLGLLTECMDQLGDVFHLRLLGMGRWIFVCSPETAKQIFRAPPGTLSAGVIHDRLLGHVFGSNATFNLDGERHRARQKIIVPLLNGPVLGRYVGLIRETALRTFGEHSGESDLPLLPVNHRLSLRILVHATLGNEDPERSDWFVRSFERFTNLGARSVSSQLPFLQVDWGPWSPWGRVLRLRKSLRDFLLREVRAREPQVEPGYGPADDHPILDHLISASKSDPKLDDEGIVDEVMNLLFAGHETTGTVLTWVLAMVYHHERVRRKILQELDREVGQGDVRPEHLDQLTYLDAVINESIRLNPIGPFSAFRQVTNPWKLTGEHETYRVPQGFVLAHSFPVMSLREDVFTQARTFRPERFFNSRFDAYHWNPFGGGGRTCSGRGLAMVELKVVVATVLRHFEIRLLSPHIQSVRRGHFLAPENGLPVDIS